MSSPEYRESSDKEPITQEEIDELLKSYRSLDGKAAALVVAREVTVEECGWLDEPVKPGTVVFRFTQPTYGVCDLDNGMPVSREPDEYPFFELPRNALVGELE